MWPLILWDTLDFPIDPLGHLTCPLTPWEPMGFPLGPPWDPQDVSLAPWNTFDVTLDPLGPPCPK